MTDLTLIEAEPIVVVSKQAAEALASAARDALRANLLGLTDESIWTAIPSEIFNLPAPIRANVTVRTEGAVRASMSGEGNSLGDHVRSALQNCLKDKRYGRLVLSDADRATLELWIQVDSTAIPVDERENENAIDLGYHGLEVEWNDAFAYYKPSVALTSHFKTASEMLSALCRKAGLFDTAWRMEGCRVSKTRWLHLSVSDAEVFELSRLRATRVPRLSVSELKSLVVACSTYLTNNQYPDGTYCYLWNPLDPKRESNESNSVRASGCAYAMAKVIGSGLVSHDPLITAGARRALSPIIDKCRPWRDGELVCEERSGDPCWGKLGTTALLAATLAVPNAFDDLCEKRDALFRTLAACQRPDGSFKCHPGSSRLDGGTVEFYPGEALVALGILSERSGGGFDVMERAFTYYRDHFSHNPTTAFVGWHADAWSRAFLLSGDVMYASFVFEQVDWLLNMQITESDATHLAGGFSVAPGLKPQVTSVVYTEAVLRGLATAFALGDQRRMERYQRAALAGLSFCRGLILGKEQSAFVSDRKRCMGGVTGSYYHFNIRADHVQHMLTLLLTSLENIELLSV